MKGKIGRSKEEVVEKTVESTVWIEGVFLRTAWRPIRYPSPMPIHPTGKTDE